jgi:hypothetical protein
MGKLKTSSIKVQYLLLAPFAVVLLMQFNNCSKYKQPADEQTSISANTPLSDLGEVKGITKTGDLCEDSIREHFYEGYYQMAVANCIQCHAVDNDKPQFANPDANWAYDVFQTRGYNKISNNAISSTHNPPATGPHLATEINDLKVKWRLAIDEYNACKGLPPVVEEIDPRQIINFETENRTIGALAVGRSTWLHWNVNGQILSIRSGINSPAIAGGAKFSIKVTRRQTAAGTDYYTFTEPVIWDNVSSNVKVKTLYIKLNGRVMSYATTFKFVNKFIYTGSDLNDTNPQAAASFLNGLVSAGGLMVLGTVSANDEVKVAFEELRQGNDAPPIPAPVTVGFASTAVRIVNSTNTGLDADRKMRVRVQVNGNADLPIVMAVNRVNDAVCGATGDNSFVVNNSSCLPTVYAGLGTSLQNANNTRFNKARSRDDTIIIRNSNGDNIPVKIFDWDFKILNPTFTLLGNNAFYDIEIEFSGDIRRENNRVLRLQLESLSNFGTIVNGELFIIIHKADNDNALARGEMTFSALMRTGTLRQSCVECHNSTELNGGYDVSNYKLMVTNGVLDLTNPINSKMFNRMNPNYLGNETLAPMPRDGYLPDNEIDPVRRWIQAGAKNN